MAWASPPCGGLALPDGTPLADDQKVILALNNYRWSGGSGYPHVTAAPIVYEEQKAVRDLMIDWAIANKTIDPATFFVKNWTVGTSSLPTEQAPEETPAPAPSATATPSAEPTATPSTEPATGASTTPAPSASPSASPSVSPSASPSTVAAGTQQTPAQGSGSLAHTGAAALPYLGAGALLLLAGTAVTLARHRKQSL